MQASALGFETLSHIAGLRRVFLQGWIAAALPAGPSGLHRTGETGSELSSPAGARLSPGQSCRGWGTVVELGVPASRGSRATKRARSEHRRTVPGRGLGSQIHPAGGWAQTLLLSGLLCTLRLNKPQPGSALSHTGTRQDEQQSSSRGPPETRLASPTLPASPSCRGGHIQQLPLWARGQRSARSCGSICFFFCVFFLGGVIYLLLTSSGVSPQSR